MDDRNAAPETRIDIVSDAICPWCYIGKRQLERSLRMLEAHRLRFTVHWNPFQLNPDMPKDGADRAAYRAGKFGSAERAAALDAQVAQAARSVGLAFRPDLMARTPNTLDAHRLIWLAGQRDVQDQVVEAVFAAYFTHGRDIGRAEVLADCGAEAGLDRGEAMEFLASDFAVAETRAADRAAREAGVSGVPSFFLNGYGLLSGAVPAEQMAEALRRGHAILHPRTA
ncbi:MAG TPA: DsbA family oxidoreductase [Acetobacteraceae bacterium]|nr:DsbA family oxidoreductase [Acetobacteraceae bacterium]